MNHLSPFPLIAALVLAITCTQPVHAAAAASQGSSSSRVIPPGETANNGDVEVINASNSRGSATEDPCAGAENETATTVKTGQGFMGEINSLDGGTTQNGGDKADLGSRSGTQAQPVKITGSGGTIVMRSDVWCAVTNNGSNGTITAKDVSGNILGTWGPGQNSTIHHP